MKITFNRSDYQETEKVPYYCLEYHYIDEDKKRIINFGLKQRKLLLEFLDKNLRENKIECLTIKIKSYEK